MQMTSRALVTEGAAIQQGATPFQAPILELPREVLYSKAPQSHVRAINQHAEDGQSTSLKIPEREPNEIESLETATSNKAPLADSHVETWSCFLQRGNDQCVSLYIITAITLQVCLRYMIL